MQRRAGDRQLLPRLLRSGQLRINRTHLCRSCGLAVQIQLQIQSCMHPRALQHFVHRTPQPANRQPHQVPSSVGTGQGPGQARPWAAVRVVLGALEDEDRLLEHREVRQPSASAYGSQITSADRLRLASRP